MKLNKKAASIYFLLMVFTFIAEGYSTKINFTYMKWNQIIAATSNFPIAVTQERNSSDYIVSLSGISPLMLNWLSTRFGFSYSIFQTKKGLKLDSTSNTPGLISYLVDGKCDVVIGAFAMSANRIPLIDFSQGYLYTTNAFVIPMPDSLNNFAAVVKPFQLSVWLAIILAILCVFVAFYLSYRLRPKASSRKSRKRSNKWTKRHINVSENANNVWPLQNSPTSLYFTSFPLYIFGLLLNQGGNYPDGRLDIRLILTGWVLSAFVLVTGYNSVLISYVTSPNAEPLIHSIKDLTNVSTVKIVVDRGLGVDLGLSLATEGIYKQMGDKLRSYPNSRCVKTDECVELVKSGGHVYINTLLATLGAIKKDFLLTGRCDLALAKQREYATPWVWALAKKSPVGEYINRGILEMRDYGLIDFWTQWYQPDVRQCLVKADMILSRQQHLSDDPPRLSLKNLTGAFAILIGGTILSLLVFIVERIFAHIKEL